MSQPRLELVLGTRNRKKGRELADLFAPAGIAVRTLDEFPSAVEVEEDGDSFAANASKKAIQQARAVGRWVLGEDSGLSVDALDGAPGIFSARFSGASATDEQNNRHLLKKLEETPPEKRSAHYVCYMVVSDPAGNVRAESEGICRGRIRNAPSGTAGFGYDPLFEILEYHRTFGELGEAVKAALSHRARAARKLLPQLLKVLSESPTAGAQ